MAQHQQTSGTTQAADEGFAPVQGGGARRSGTVLLVEAYAAIWLILMLFVWKTNARQRKIEQRLGQLSAELEHEEYGEQ